MVQTAVSGLKVWIGLDSIII